ncbi:uncharacterized protein [Cicer arietinum]|uniref:uncharacterized protein isoform X2 n=1 Tax=Cicer arietinum TaxID=3827 RepID=UPI003CC6BA8C
MNYSTPQKEDIFRTYMYDYLKKRGMLYVAEVFRIEALVTRHPPFEFNQHPHGFLHDFWIFIQNGIFSPSLQMPLGSSNQALNIGTIPTQQNGIQNGFVPTIPTQQNDVQNGFVPVNVGTIPTQQNGVQNGFVPVNVDPIPTQQNGVQNGFVPVNVGAIPTQQNGVQNGFVPVNVGAIPTQQNDVQNGFVPINVGTITTQQNGVVPINVGSVPKLNSLPQQYDGVARKLGTVPRLDSLRQQYGVVPKNVGTIQQSNPLPQQYDVVPVNPSTRPRLDSLRQKYGVVTKNVGTIPQSKPLPQQHDVVPANPSTRPRLDPLLQQYGVAPVKDPGPTIWDTNFQRHGEKFSVKFLSDGKIVASGGLGKKAIICYMDTSDCVTTSQSHSAPISDVRFQQKTTIFATCSYDYKVKLWNSNKPGTVLFDLVGHNEWVKSMDFHPLEAILCSSDNFDVLEVWDLIQCVRLKNFLVGGQQVRFEPVFGKTLAVANGNVINILDIQSWRIQNRFQGHDKEVRSICWDAQGQMVASVTEDCARVWSIAVRGKCMFEYQSKGKRFGSIIFHPRYPDVLVIGGALNMELWIPETGQVYLFPAHSGQITGLAACKQNETIASSSSDSTVKIWK